MSRVKIQFPSEKPLIEVEIPLRITDMNYGNHLANDKVLTLLHEARIKALNHYDLSEIDIGEGVSLIMADVMIRYKSEGFFGDQTFIEIWIDKFTTHSFQVYYRLIAKNPGEEIKLIAEAKTGMVCFNYEDRKVSAVPKSFIKLMKGE